MAVPSRIFVGITIFGLICVLVIVPFTVIVVTCDPSPAARDLFGQFAGKDCTIFDTGQKIFLTLASILTVSFTVLAWRALLAGARRDAIRRARRAAEADTDPAQATEPSPPDRS